MTWSGQHVYGHDGATIGQGAFMRIVPGKGVAVCLLTNGGHARDLFGDLFNEILGELAGRPAPGAARTAADAPGVDLHRTSAAMRARASR